MKRIHWINQFRQQKGRRREWITVLLLFCHWKDKKNDLEWSEQRETEGKRMEKGFQEPFSVFLYRFIPFRGRTKSLNLFSIRNLLYFPSSKVSFLLNFTCWCLSFFLSLFRQLTLPLNSFLILHFRFYSNLSYIFSLSHCILSSQIPFLTHSFRSLIICHQCESSMSVTPNYPLYPIILSIFGVIHLSLPVIHLERRESLSSSQYR